MSPDAKLFGTTTTPGWQEERKALLRKLAKVAEDCHYIRKDAKNEFHKYKYVSAANVLEKISEACQKHGLTSYTWADLEEIRERTTSKGSIEYIAVMRVRLTIADIDTGHDVVVSALGAGQDQGDKAVMKAQTAGLKYCWMMCLNISTGDDPEADSSTAAYTCGRCGGRLRP